MSFPDFVNENLKGAIENIISTNRIPHAILIEGDNIDDARTLADYIAKSAVCRADNKPCGICSDCHLAEVGTHPDISVIGLEDGKKNVSVSQIRQLRSNAFVKAHSAEHRVFIIENADKMNEQAQNALLKVLEEPPKGVIFILIAVSRTLLLKTVISRCSVFSLSSAETSQKENKTETMAKEYLRMLFDGSEYEMLKLLSKLEKDRNLSDEFFCCLQIQCVEMLKKSPKNGARAKTLAKLYLDIQIYKEQLKTNVNLPLIFCTATIKANKER